MKMIWLNHFHVKCYTFDHEAKRHNLIKKKIERQNTRQLKNEYMKCKKKANRKTTKHT